MLCASCPVRQKPRVRGAECLCFLLSTSDEGTPVQMPVLASFGFGAYKEGALACAGVFGRVQPGLILRQREQVVIIVFGLCRGILQGIDPYCSIARDRGARTRSRTNTPANRR